jgi:hypothetical protein
MCGAPAQKSITPAQQVTSQPIVQQITEHHHHHQYTPPDQPVTIEKTGKKWKKLYLWAWLYMLIGIVSCSGASSSSPPSSTGMTIASIFWLMAVATYIKARAGAWWNHG